MRTPFSNYWTHCPQHMTFNDKCHPCVLYTLAHMGRKIAELEESLGKEIHEARRDRYEKPILMKQPLPYGMGGL